MLQLFKRKSKKTALLAPAWQKLNTAVTQQQRKIADRLQDRTQGWSRRKLIYMLVFFCIVFGGSSGYIIWQGLYGKDKHIITIAPIDIPIRIDSDFSARNHKNGASVDAAYLPIRRFLHYMDSLGKSPSGRATYDSILKARPGLMDSIALLNKIYQIH